MVRFRYEFWQMPVRLTSAVRYWNPTTSEITAQWTNGDGSVVQTPFLYSPEYGNSLDVTGDIDLVTKFYGTSNVVPVVSRIRHPILHRPRHLTRFWGLNSTCSIHHTSRVPTALSHPWLTFGPRKCILSFDALAAFPFPRSSPFVHFTRLSLLDDLCGRRLSDTLSGTSRLLALSDKECIPQAHRCTDWPLGLRTSPSSHIQPEELAYSVTGLHICM